MMVGQVLPMGEAGEPGAVGTAEALGGGWESECRGEYVANRDVVVLRRDVLVGLLQDGESIR